MIWGIGLFLKNDNELNNVFHDVGCIEKGTVPDFVLKTLCRPCIEYWRLCLVHITLYIETLKWYFSYKNLAIVRRAIMLCIQVLFKVLLWKV